MRNGTISLAVGADADIANGVTPEIPPPTGSTSSVVQDSLNAKAVPLSGAVIVGANTRKVAMFNATATALAALANRVGDTALGPTLNAEFVYDDDGNLIISETARGASASDQGIINDVMAPKPPVFKRFSQLISAIETAHEKAGRGCVIVFSQDGNGSLQVFTGSPSATDTAVTGVTATLAGDAAALGNGGAPLAVATVTAGAVAATKLPGE